MLTSDILQSNTNYYIYKLHKGDSIIYSNSRKQNQYFIILSGCVYISQIFTNKEILSIAILDSLKIICTKSLNITDNSYHQISSLTKTYIMSFNAENLKTTHINELFLQFIIKNYEITMKRYHIMNFIFVHRYIKQRFIQFILFLALEFGIIHEKEIFIPYKISQNQLSMIIGSNQITINKILKNLSCNIQIKYSHEKKIYIKNIFTLIEIYCY